jgi:hypothetical protein
LRGVGVIGAWAAGMRERNDEEHLLFATAQNRTLYSFNVGDYGRLQKEFLPQGRSHAGMILAKQQHCSGGDQMRRLLKLIATRSAEEMTDKIEFLSDWGD